jgi:hypothetical protein
MTCVSLHAKNCQTECFITRYKRKQLHDKYIISASKQHELPVHPIRPEVLQVYSDYCLLTQRALSSQGQSVGKEGLLLLCNADSKTEFWVLTQCGFATRYRPISTTSSLCKSQITLATSATSISFADIFHSLCRIASCVTFHLPKFFTSCFTCLDPVLVLL